MDQIKIGKLISERRKLKMLTQAQLAEILNITDRAVSKWETGKSMPDASIMLELCNILEISVNDLLNGEVVTMNNYDSKQEQILLDFVKQKEIILAYLKKYPKQGKGSFYTKDKLNLTIQWIVTCDAWRSYYKE